MSLDWLTDYTLRTILLGCIVLGITSGTLGCFAILRQQGLIGDALSHAALPGVCLAFMLTQSKSMPVLLMGAAAASWVAMVLIQAIQKWSRIDPGTGLAVVLTSFFGLGVVLLTVIQKTGAANQAGLNKFLFGQAAGLVQESVVTMAILGGAALVVMGLIFKELKLFAFDPVYASVIGINTSMVGSILSGLLIVSIVIGLNTVGVVLMSAMLVAPAAGARQWTNNLNSMMVISAASGSVCGVTGAILSATESRAPTGPVIVLALSVWVLLSIVFGRQRGIFWLRRRRSREMHRLASGEA